MTVGVAMATVACAQPNEHAPSSPPAVSNTASAGSLAALYPGDVGIEKDPDVVFVEQFEEETPAALFGRWTEVRNGGAMTFNADVPPGSPGAHSLAIPAGGGAGGHLYRQLNPGVDDTLYVRYYIKYPLSTAYSHHGVWIGGYNPPLGWPNPQAGTKPAGDDRFSVAAEQNNLTGRFDHYDYWMGMHLSADGNFWGNLLLNDPKVQTTPGRWTCVEQMVKLNRPVTASNGERAIWLDGVEVSHLGAGFPKGSWAGGIFTQDPSGRPFEGFQWRADDALDLNWLWLQVYAAPELPAAAAAFEFDHLVAAKRRVGCLSEPGATRSTATRSETERPWPNEPAGFAPFNDQPWAALSPPDAARAGAMSRALARVQSLLRPSPERRADWRYLRRTSSKDATITTDPTAPFSPGTALRIIYTPDMPPDSEPSVHWIGLPTVKEVYTAWWVKLSPNWIPTPAGGGKMTFLLAPGGAGQVYTGYYHPSDKGSAQGPPYRIGANTEWAPYGQQVWYPNVATTFVDPGGWHRIEFYYRWETTPGVSGDGIIRWWVDGTLNGDHKSVHYPPAAGFQEFQFAPTVQFPGAVERYMDVGRTYISTP